MSNAYTSVHELCGYFNLDIACLYSFSLPTNVFQSMLPMQISRFLLLMESLSNCIESTLTLESNTGVFPGPEVIDTKDPIQLTETESVLGIVFQFIYPKKHPKLNEGDFDTILAVAEAVEKYQVFSAMNTCETRLIKYLSSPDHAVEILAHAIEHDYPDVINAAVPHLARAPLIPFLEKLPSYSLLPWIRYQEAWKAVFQNALKHVIAKPVRPMGCGSPYVCVSCRQLPDRPHCGI